MIRIWKVDEKKCLSCGGCVGVCPVSALSLGQHGLKCDAGRCIECGMCQNFCPAGAISVKKTEKKG